MKKLILLLFPLFLSAEPDVHKENIAPFEGFLCSRCMKNELHDTQVALAIKCVAACISTIAGIEGLKIGKTYIQKLSMAVICAGFAHEISKYVGSLIQNRLIIIDPNYTCSKTFCKYSPKDCASTII